MPQTDQRIKTTWYLQTASCAGEWVHNPSGRKKTHKCKCQVTRVRGPQVTREGVTEGGHRQAGRTRSDRRGRREGGEREKGKEKEQEGKQKQPSVNGEEKRRRRGGECGKKH